MTAPSLIVPLALQRYLYVSYNIKYVKYYFAEELFLVLGFFRTQLVSLLACADCVVDKISQ